MQLVKLEALILFKQKSDALDFFRFFVCLFVLKKKNSTRKQRFYICLCFEAPSKKGKQKMPLSSPLVFFFFFWSLLLFFTENILKILHKKNASFSLFFFSFNLFKERPIYHSCIFFLSPKQVIAPVTRQDLVSNQTPAFQVFQFSELPPMQVFFGSHRSSSWTSHNVSSCDRGVRGIS